MSDRPQQFDELFFLLSRSLDEDLTDGERRRLDAALAESASLRAESDALRAVDRLVRRWGERSIELDWPTHERLIRASVQEDASLAEVDELVARWGRTEVSCDDAAFVDGVMERIAAESGVRRTLRMPRWYRIGVPLAAAAAIVFAVTARQWFTAPSPVCDVSYGTSPGIESNDAAIGKPPRLVVQFTQVSQERRVPAPIGMSYGSVGAEPLPDAVDDWERS